MFVLKRKRCRQTGDRDEWAAKLLPPNLPYRENKRWVTDSWPARASMWVKLAKTCLLLCSVRDGCSVVVCGQCVWVKIRPVAAVWRRQDTFEAHERGLSARLSAGCCSTNRKEKPGLRFDRHRWGKSEQSNSNRSTAATKTAGCNSAPMIWSRTVTESIIYFRTLNSGFQIPGSLMS